MRQELRFPGLLLGYFAAGAAFVSWVEDLPLTLLSMPAWVAWPATAGLLLLAVDLLVRLERDAGEP